MLKIAVCDDEKLHLEKAVRLIGRVAENYMPEIEAFGSAEELTKAVGPNGYLPDIAVLDIKLEGTDGITLAKRLNSIAPLCQIIFLTSYLDLAPDVYSAEHVYFVLKKDAESRIGDAVERAVSAISRQKDINPYIAVKTHRSMTAVPVSDILYLERNGRKTGVAVAGGCMWTSQTPKELLNDTVAGFFIQSHQSFWVNAHKIVSIDTNSFILSDGLRIPLSRSYRQSAREKFFSVLRE
jgi:DNA-binding LytR/AlgR family response regulator